MSPNTPRRAAIAVLVAILSVVLVTAGSATAARLITGKDIKNGSVTGKNIKNKSVGAADLSAGAKKSLTGPAGPAGPAGGTAGPAGPMGPGGPAGAPGPAVLTDVYAASLSFELLAQDTAEVVLSKVLPASKPYLFTAKLNLTTAGVGQHVCELRSGVDVIDSATVSTSAVNSRSPIMMTGVTASSRLARVSCTVAGGNGAVQQVKLPGTTSPPRSTTAITPAFRISGSVAHSGEAADGAAEIKQGPGRLGWFGSQRREAWVCEHPLASSARPGVSRRA